MKRFILCVCTFLLPLSAAASPELAEEWGVKAGTLYNQSVELIQTLNRDGEITLGDNYITDLERFALTATRLGSWNDERTGARDLGCIFRGMAEEAERQLDVLETPEADGAQAAALRRLVTMFDDAQTIAAAAASAARAGITETPANASEYSCPANRAFLEQFSNQQASEP